MRILTARRTLLKMGLAAVALPGCLRIAGAATRPIAVVELFTSQGCSRCPPADALFVELAERSNIVALAYHIDYWDYLGWEDSLAVPENTERQHAYGEVLGTGVYTPQIVVNGQKDVVGADRNAVLNAVQPADGAGGLAVDVALSTAGKNIAIEIGGGESAEAGAHVLLVYYRPSYTAEIRAGENKGKTVEYRNIVTGHQTVGVWHGKEMRLEFPKSEIKSRGGCCAVLVQSADEDGNPKAILGAAQMSAVS
ncbi:thioredoxin family protein [Chelativorans sp. J32]|uniref:DUF1223 domain-containing protein n=1 Tax=Chelativorans sp. J32 TaxID=935840 RepID=UPI0004853659|nr:DUF1223 domain-containing protein [Chelativorans sp. J32]